MTTRVGAVRRRPNFVSLGDLFWKQPYEAMYADAIHYGDRACGEMARGAPK
ncbi:MAG: hypothetical protein M3P29_04395 [Acidobacteriota bacterium]|nr:hypothetical protein [Acidobacteriota bacterium]